MPRGGPVLSRLLSALGAGIAVVALAAVAPASPAPGAQTPVIKLVGRAGHSAPQGLPFAFRATVTNPGPITVSANIFFELVAPAPDRRSVPFLGKILVIPPSTTVRVDGTVTSSQWFSERGSFRIKPLANLVEASGNRAKGTIAGDPLTFDVVASPVIVPTFQDRTKTAGLSTTVPDGTCAHWTNGAAWADVNGDGYLDLAVTRGGQPVQLFINNGHGHFQDEAAARGIDNGGLLAQGAVFADYNNDGSPDLYLLNDGANRLYRNDGTGHFTDVAPLAGVTDADSIGTSASWGDYDNDGFLDLYVTNHSRCLGDSARHSLQYLPDKLYHNNGDGTFTDVTALLGDGATNGAGFEAAWFDYNGDGRPDLYLANDYLGQSPDANHLWRNDGASAGGEWHFSDVSSSSGTGYAMNTMGIAVGDYNRDLKLDLALSNIKASRLLRNNGDGTFTDVAGPAGMSRPDQRLDQKSVTWGAVFSDLDNDGWEDLYFAAGFLEAYPDDVIGPQHNELFVNAGNGKFLDLSAPSLADDVGQSRGVALADFDRDGRVDVYVVNQAGSPRLYRNVTPIGNRHWLEVDTIGTVSNRDGCGARLILTAGGVSMLREVFCGSTSVSSGSDSTVHFGLGPATRVAQLVIEWPSGTRQVLRNLEADRLLKVTEG
jgi:hypothetical protein